MSVLGVGNYSYENYGASALNRRGQKADGQRDFKGFQARKTQKNPEKQQMGNVKVYTVYMGDEDTLYSGGNGTGLSFYIKWAEDSTDEDPVMVAKGVDENGDEFEQRIHINDINPNNSSLVEMRALEAYTGVEKNGGLTSLPMGTGDMGLYDRRNFMQMFSKEISDMNLLKQRASAAYYEYSMRNYWDFLEERKENNRL